MVGAWCKGSTLAAASPADTIDVGSSAEVIPAAWVYVFLLGGRCRDACTAALYVNCCTHRSAPSLLASCRSWTRRLQQWRRWRRSSGGPARSAALSMPAAWQPSRQSRCRWVVGLEWGPMHCLRLAVACISAQLAVDAWCCWGGRSHDPRCCAQTDTSWHTCLTHGAALLHVRCCLQGTAAAAGLTLTAKSAALLPEGGASDVGASLCKYATDQKVGGAAAVSVMGSLARCRTLCCLCGCFARRIRRCAAPMWACSWFV